jgi:hypothetical protein
MSLEQHKVGAYETFTVGLTVDNSTRAKILVDETPSATALDTLQADLTLRGGCRAIGGQIASTDGTARSLLIWTGRVLTTQSAGATGTLQAATTSTITRASGDFRTDGWAIGDGIMLLPALGERGPASATVGNTGVAFIVTAVAALTLTFNGTPLTAETFNAGARLARVAQRTRKAVAANAGNADATPPVALFGGSQDTDQAPQPDTGLQLGPKGVLLVSLAAAASALPARIDVSAHVLLS